MNNWDMMRFTSFYNPQYTPFLEPKPNWRGVKDDEIVGIAQAIRSDVEGLLEINADTEAWRASLAWCKRGFDNCSRELQRSAKISYEGITQTNQEIILFIKHKLDIADVLEWYTDVFYPDKYRCTLHGADKHPSGKIYPDQHCHCFTCGKNGDVFDVVQWFENIDFMGALKKLARYVGIELKPIYKKNGNGEAW